MGYYGSDPHDEPLVRVLPPEPWDEGLQTPMDPRGSFGEPSGASRYRAAV